MACSDRTRQQNSTQRATPRGVRCAFLSIDHPIRPGILIEHVKSDFQLIYDTLGYRSLQQESCLLHSLMSTTIPLLFQSLERSHAEIPLPSLCLCLDDKPCSPPPDRRAKRCGLFAHAGSGAALCAASIIASATLCSSRWTQRRGRQIDRVQNRRTHRARLPTEKPLCCRRAVRSGEEKVVNGGEAFPLAGPVQPSKLMGAQRPGAVAPRHMGT